MGSSCSTTSFCRLCEALCGITVETVDDKVTSIRGDRDNPASRGFLCPKGAAFVDIQNDPDRVLYPLRRQSDGSFERVSWDDALSDIATRLRAVIDRHGGDATGYYVGNPAAFAFPHMFWLKGLFDALGAVTHQYNTNSQDGGARLVASSLLYGSPFTFPLPDIDRTHFMLILGANPLVSMGSAVSAPRIRERLDAIVRRGGRVVVVDPRRTPTAQRYEHLAIRPDEDAWLLLGLLRETFVHGRASSIEGSTTGASELRELVEPFTLDEVAAHTGMPAATVATLAANSPTRLPPSPTVAQAPARTASAPSSAG